MGTILAFISQEQNTMAALVTQWIFVIGFALVFLLLSGILGAAA